MTFYHFVIYYLCIILGSYFIGSIPTGYLVAKAHGVNIFTHGSGNPGAANLKRVLGTKAGIITLFVDILKGTIATFLPQAILLTQSISIHQSSIDQLSAISGLMSILGHCYPAILGLRGGKGVATSFGVFLALSPFAATFAAITFLLVYKLSKYTSLSSIISTISLPIWIVVTQQTLTLDNPIFIISIICVPIIIYRHKDNIYRLKGSKELTL